MSLVACTRLDAYEVVAPLGAGGMGEVYRACDGMLKRDVAIKVLPDFWSRDPERLHRFELEAQAAAALNHPNIVSSFTSDSTTVPLTLSPNSCTENHCVSVCATAPCACGRQLMSV